MYETLDSNAGHIDGKPIYNWARDIEDGALQQAINLSRLPFIVDHVAMMPDAHQGYGMPVGGVMHADGAVVPYAIGVDIGCGVTLIEIEDAGWSDDLLLPKVKPLLDQIARDVPVGNGPQAEHQIIESSWSASNEQFITGDGKEYLFDIFDRAETQLGTLGGGNHFLELQRTTTGRLFFMIHSGSRSVGKKICDHWQREALALCKQEKRYLPHDELAYFLQDDEGFAGYWYAMSLAMQWAEYNRSRMAEKVVYGIRRVLEVDAFQSLDVHHNFAAWEEHYGVLGVTHRKGSIRARTSDTVLIPGSMGTSSWAGLGKGSEAAFESCQHGAGRARSRGATRRMTSLPEMRAALDLAGVTLVTPARDGALDESPIAYKDIDDVMARSTDLVSGTVQLFPVGVVKG